MNVPQLLVDDDETSADENLPTETFVAHFHHGLHHDARRALNRQRAGVEEQLEPPQYLGVGVSDDRQKLARFLIDDIGGDKIEIFRNCPGLVIAV